MAEVPTIPEKLEDEVRRLQGAMENQSDVKPGDETILAVSLIKR